MTEFRALPVDDAVTLIRTWAEADWPLTREKTYEIRDKLGWKPTPGHENYFTTNLGFGHEDAGAHFRTSEPNVEKIDFLLARFGSSSIPATNHLVIREAFEKYCAAMTGLWGDSVESNRQDVMAREWTLCSGAQVRISIAGWFIQALVRSPEAAAQRARDIEFEEKYGFEDEDEQTLPVFVLMLRDGVVQRVVVGSAEGSDCVRVGPGGFGVRTTEGRIAIALPQYLGATATLDTTPRPTRFEGPAAQSTPAYVRERVLTDPRVASYVAENPDLWQRVKAGDVEMDIRVITTSDLDAGPITTTPTPFTLTPQVEQALDAIIQHLRTTPGKNPLP